MNVAIGATIRKVLKFKINICSMLTVKGSPEDIICLAHSKLHLP